MDEEEDLGSSAIPGEQGALRLLKRGDEFILRVHDHELMNSRAHASEDALGSVPCLRLSSVAEPVVLIGGLGMGFTLAAALGALGPRARVVVSELIPAVVGWNRGPLAHLAGRPLQDPRLTIRIEDVAQTLRASRGVYDAVMLDVDNGPTGLTRGSNDWLYSDDGLAAGYRALRRNGCLAVWSSTPERSFISRLNKVGFSAEELIVPIGDGEQNTIWLAVRD